MGALKGGPRLTQDVILTFWIMDNFLGGYRSLLLPGGSLEGVNKSSLL